MTEQQMKCVGVEMVDCFFCENPNICKFIDGKGYVVLGEKIDGSDYGAHAMCDNCRKPGDWGGNAKVKPD